MRESLLKNLRRFPWWRILFQVIIWVIVLLFPLLSYNVRVLDSAFYIKECINNAWLIGLFYLHMNFLIPRYFVRNRITAYFTFVLLAIVLVLAEQHIVEYNLFRRISNENAHRPLIVETHRAGVAADGVDKFRFPPGPGYRGRFGRPMNGHDDYKIAGLPAFIFFMTLRKALFSALLLLLASGFIKIALEWFKAERRREELEKEKLHAELGFLKSQVNPHFLFNSLNSIYALAQRKSDEAPEAILQLSQMMRYMIYESNTGTVALQKELDYLQDYIHLKKLRLARNVEIVYIIEGSATGLQIEPMLLIPFVENAFKHGISYVQACVVQIKIALMQHKLVLTVSNSIFPRQETEAGGLGLQNVQKRLMLLYPNEQHSLHITQENNIYHVCLSISLKKAFYD